MGEPMQEMVMGPYMLSEVDAVRFMGLTPKEFMHVMWLKQIFCYPAGERNYYPRPVLQKALDELFAESQDLGVRLARLSPDLFWRKYGELYPSNDVEEIEIRETLEKELANYDIREVAKSMNFGNSMGMLYYLSDLEKARIVDVLMEMDVLTEMGKAYHACVKVDLEAK